MSLTEINFDGLIGPTHNYAGLALGNLAATANAGAAANPRAAALQGLAKMRKLHEKGLAQGFFPPHDRPHLATLRGLGFTGNDRDVLSAVASTPDLLANVYSASAMWTANAATVAPSPDTADGRVHFTPANLAGNFHRSIEAATTTRILRHVFPDPARFAVHPPLPGGIHFGDEGAANHARLAPRGRHGRLAATPGVQLFVYGESGDAFAARQRRAASEAVSRRHGLAPQRALFLQQSRRAIDAGAFHNDVVGLAHEDVLFTHEDAFEDRESALAAIEIAAPFATVVEARRDAVPLADAVSSYLFNSQIVTAPDGTLTLILPKETEETPRAKAFVDETLSADNPIGAAVYVDVRESMRNGGGPACLRLRVALADAERAAMNGSFIVDDERLDKLEAWVGDHYRDRLAPEDLRDPSLMDEARAALDALTQILDMGAFYDFQR
ncbi:MAG: N-succinylarginine dihydrolase [Parvularculaceae bacterium]